MLGLVNLYSITEISLILTFISDYMAVWLFLTRHNDAFQSFFVGITSDYLNLKRIMGDSENKVGKFFSGYRILIAVLLGVSVSGYLIFRDFDSSDYQHVYFNGRFFLFVALAVLMMVIRDFAYMIRIRVLLDNTLSWKRSFQVIMLWEFASALTPSVVGGSAAALYIVSKEKISMGKTTAIVMITALMDELFYIVMVPIMLLVVGVSTLFVHSDLSVFGMFILPTEKIFWIGYFFILSLTMIISFAIFFSPHYFKRILLSIFSLPLLRKWKEKIRVTGDEIVTTSEEVKGKPLSYWMKAIGATFLSWTARFLVVNFLILAVVQGGDQFLIYARQLVMWVILLLSPTPGGSGVAEGILPLFLGEFMNGLGNEIAFSWRLISYYAYLVIGSIVLPAWISRVYKKSKSTS